MPERGALFYFHRKLSNRIIELFFTKAIYLDSLRQVGLDKLNFRNSNPFRNQKWIKHLRFCRPKEFACHPKWNALLDCIGKLLCASSRSALNVAAKLDSNKVEK